jgi:hypothetical protein
MPRDVMICLGDCDSDSVLLPLPHYLPDSTRQILPSAVRSSSTCASEMPFMALMEYASHLSFTLGMVTEWNHYAFI